jgi:hypothetical protein
MIEPEDNDDHKSKKAVINAMMEAVRSKRLKHRELAADGPIEPTTDTDLGVGGRLVVETVSDPSTELSLTEAREIAGAEVEIGDVLMLPSTFQS